VKLLKQKSLESNGIDAEIKLPAVIKADAPKPEFSWDDPEAVVLAEQRKTAVYWANNELVIRQQSPLGDEDSIILISEDQDFGLVDRMCDLIGIPSVGGPG
jgi:hypothetical protein